MTMAELRTWASELTSEQLTAALYEMRDRGAAVAYYDAAEVRTMFDGYTFETDPEDYFDDEGRAIVEEAMCEAARQLFEHEFGVSEPEFEDEDEWEGEAA